jgi:hypothetical protein
MKRLLALLALAVVFTSCIYTVRRNPDGSTTTTQTGGASVSVSISFGVRVTNIIQDFQPDRGTGSTYRVGDPVTLRLVSREAGYVTLVIYNPFNYRNTEIRNIPVQRGTNIIPRQNALTASLPTGVTRFRAFFTPEPNNSVSFTNGASEQYLDSQTSAYLSPYPVELRDVRETFLNVR